MIEKGRRGPHIQPRRERGRPEQCRSSCGRPFRKKESEGILYSLYKLLKPLEAAGKTRDHPGERYLALATCTVCSCWC